jgi:hypothetical protein
MATSRRCSGRNFTVETHPKHNLTESHLKEVEKSIDEVTHFHWMSCMKLLSEKKVNLSELEIL